ncbi:MAG: glycine dehydrogenase subunit 2 [Myxococcales bacterium]|nr:glycine dehydrogenase subunit 2 [Myxococcales bacterium]
MTQSAASGLTFRTPLLFEQGRAGRSGASLPTAGVPDADPKALFGELYREAGTPLPELSEPEVFRHYVRLSQQNFSVDTGMYPLGSCTMKYNPKVNEWAARLPGFSRIHPWAPESSVQGALALMWHLERALSEICGMDAVSLHPSAGAQGEMTGLMMIHAYHQAQGRSPKKVLIPDTAHGTNPASAALNGLTPVAFPVGESGVVDPAVFAASLDDDVAALMLTNPNTVGLFERHLPELAAMVHAKGGLVFGDGANLNALMGRARPGDLGVDVMQLNLHKTFTTPHGGGGPGSGPVGYKAKLAPHAPAGGVVRGDDGRFSFEDVGPGSVGRLRAFHANFGMLVRAYTYIRELGGEGLKRATDLAVLNANYLRVCLGETWHEAFEGPCMHEVVIDDHHLHEQHVSTLDVAKRLMDYGFHPPTIYFPLVVHGAMLIEPTETESKQTLDEFVAVMAKISQEAMETPDEVRGAPHLTRLGRLDETRAARKPVLRWMPSEATSDPEG